MLLISTMLFAHIRYQFMMLIESMRKGKSLLELFSHKSIKIE